MHACMEMSYYDDILCICDRIRAQMSFSHGTKSLGNQARVKNLVFTSLPKKIELEVAGQTLDCYCVCCELLCASKADALLFVNILVSSKFHGHFAQ